MTSFERSPTKMWKWFEVSSLAVLLDWYAQLTRISYTLDQTLFYCVFCCGTHVVVDAAAVEGLHASLGRTRVIVLDESVVEALCLVVS